MESIHKRQAAKEALKRLEVNWYSFTEDTVNMGQETYMLCKELDDKDGMAFSLLICGRVYAYLNDYQKALDYSFDSISIAQEIDICDLQFLAYLNMGSIYFDMDDFEKSLDYYTLAQKTMDTFKHSKNYFSSYTQEFYLSKIYNNMGEVYRLHDMFQEAARYYELAYEYDQKEDFHATFGVILINLAYIQCHLKQYQKALEYLEESIAYLSKYQYVIGLVEAYGVMAFIYQKQKDVLKGEVFFKKALTFSSEIDYAYTKIDLYIHYAQFLEENQRETEAIDNLLMAYQLCEESLLFHQGMEVCKHLIRFYENIKDEQSAVRYYRLYFENQKNQELNCNPRFQFANLTSGSAYPLQD